MKRTGRTTPATIHHHWQFDKSCTTVPLRWRSRNQLLSKRGGRGRPDRVAGPSSRRSPLPYAYRTALSHCIHPSSTWRRQRPCRPVHTRQPSPWNDRIRPAAISLSSACCTSAYVVYYSSCAGLSRRILLQKRNLTDCSHPPLFTLSDANQTFNTQLSDVIVVAITNDVIERVHINK